MCRHVVRAHISASMPRTLIGVSELGRATPIIQICAGRALCRHARIGMQIGRDDFACSGSAADAERDCRGRPDSWHGGLTNEPGPLPGSRNLANHGAPIDAYYATSRQAKVRLCARDGSATGYAGSVHIMHSGVLPAAKRAAITPAPPLSPDGLPAPSRTRITAAAGTVPAAGRDDGAFRPGRR